MSKFRFIHPKIHSHRLIQFLNLLPVTTRKLLKDCRLTLYENELFILPTTGDELRGNAVRLRRRKILKAMRVTGFTRLYFWLNNDIWHTYNLPAGKL